MPRFYQPCMRCSKMEDCSLRCTQLPHVFVCLGMWRDLATERANCLISPGASLRRGTPFCFLLRGLSNSSHNTDFVCLRYGPPHKAGSVGYLASSKRCWRSPTKWVG